MAFCKEVRHGTDTLTPLVGLTEMMIRRARRLRVKQTAPMPAMFIVWELAVNSNGGTRFIPAR